MHRLPVFMDMRGSLTVAELGKHLPFAPKRFFMVYDVPSKHVRGEHAHKTLHQFLVCLKGEVTVMVDNGAEREEVRLTEPTIGVYVPPMLWAVQYKFSPDAVLLVFASDVYDASDYIRDYDDYVRVVGKKSTGR